MQQIIHSAWKRFKRGFTLVELVIVIAVIAILAAVLIPTFITVIDNANDSADTQLVANMNTALSTEIYADQTATAENLRKLLKDFGYDAEDLATKNGNNVIVYNKTTKRFEKLNYKDANLTLKKYDASGISSTAAVKLKGEDDAGLVIDTSPYAPEEIFDGYIITSTAGNDLAEALYSLHNSVQNEEGSNIVESKLLNNGQIDAKISNGIKNLLGTTLYVDQSGDMSRLVVTGSEGHWEIEKKQPNDASVSSDLFRIVFNEECKELDASKLATALGGRAITIAVPYTVESIINMDSVPSSGLSNKIFAGNTSIFKDIDEDVLKAAGCSVAEKSLTDIKNAIAGPEIEKNLKLLAREEFYYVDSGFTIPTPGDWEKEEKLQWYYTDIQLALNAASQSAEISGKFRTVVLADNDVVLTKDITIPANVVLSIPYFYQQNTTGSTNFGTDKAMPLSGYYLRRGAAFSSISSKDFNDRASYGNDPKDLRNMNWMGYKFTGEKSIVDDDVADIKANYNKTYKQFQLTINKGVTVTVADGGCLTVGGVVSYNDGGAMVGEYNGHVSGNYAQIINKGNIVVENGGDMEVYGYIKGEGKVTAENGSEIHEPLLVADGSPFDMVMLYMQNASPFMRYSVLNVQCPMEVKYGAVVDLSFTWYANSAAMFFEDGITLIGYTSAEDSDLDVIGLITMTEEESSILWNYSYSKDHAIKDETAGSNLMGDIGTTKVTINGKAKTQALNITVSIMAVNTKTALFPIPYNFEYQINGVFDIYNRFVVLPGAKVIVNNGGTINITKNSEFYVVDSLKQGARMNGYMYPTAQQLTTAKYSQSGELIVNGVLNIAANTKVGGVVRANDAGATLQIDSSADLKGEFSIGGAGVQDYNLSTYKSPLRIRTGSALVEAKAGDTYTSSGTSGQVKMEGSISYARLFDAQKDSAQKDQEITYDKVKAEIKAQIGDTQGMVDMVMRPWGTKSYIMDTETYSVDVTTFEFTASE